MDISKLLTSDDKGPVGSDDSVSTAAGAKENAVSAKGEQSSAADSWRAGSRGGGERPSKRPKPDPSKSHQCSQCSSSFTTRSNLMVHTQTVHEGKRPYKCEHCDRSFGTKGTMNRHIRLVHFHERQYVCGVCDRAFATLACLRRHHGLLHGESMEQFKR